MNWQNYSTQIVGKSCTTALSPMAIMDEPWFSSWQNEIIKAHRPRQPTMKPSMNQTTWIAENDPYPNHNTR